MRGLAVVAALLFGACASEEAPVVRAQDGTPIACIFKDTSFCVPVGSSCDRSEFVWCGNGAAWCSPEGTCQSFCAAVDYPPCPAGYTPEREVLTGEAHVCSCRRG